jgi:predicted amidohydrolase
MWSARAQDREALSGGGLHGEGGVGDGPKGHSIANGLPVVAVNRTGTEGRITFWGSSFVTDAFGTALCRMGCDEEGVAVRRVDLSKSEAVREGWGFLRCRRPELYRHSFLR